MDTRSRYLDALGIGQWVPRSAVAPGPVVEVPASSPPAQLPATAELGVSGWPALEAEVAACTQCPLHAGRTRTVFGAGNRLAEWMVVGEAPGADEDRAGEPFVGPAGQLLTAMLKAIDLPREDVFMTDIVKCRPAGDRDVAPAEAACCRPNLDRQIALIRPRMLLAFGPGAAKELLRSEAPLDTLRGQVHRFGDSGTPLIVTYHPAFLLRSPGDKRKAWEDLKLARRVFVETYGGGHGA